MSDGIAQKKTLFEAEKFLIREASPKEVEALRKIYREVLFEDPVDNVGKKLILVAIDKKTNEVIGGMERAIDVNSGYAQGIGFAVSAKSQSMGVGTNLLKVMDEELKNIGIKHITTLPSSEASWKIFKSNGYEYPPAVKAYVDETIKETGKDKFIKTAMFKEL